MISGFSPPGTARTCEWRGAHSAPGRSTTPTSPAVDSAPFVLAGGGRRIEVAFDASYPYAQVYAPDDDDVIALEPMTAPTNALVGGGAELPLVPPGESYRASFSVTVADLGG